MQLCYRLLELPVGVCVVGMVVAEGKVVRDRTYLSSFELKRVGAIIGDELLSLYLMDELGAPPKRRLVAWGQGGDWGTATPRVRFT